jgi:S1-C subfamily serine protease
MDRLTQLRWRRLAAVLVVAPALWAATAWAADLPATRPILDALNRETQTLFKDVAGSIVRVQLPLGRIAGGADDPLAKWAGRLDPQTRQRLEELHLHAPDNPYHSVEVRSATQPSDGQGGTVILTLSRFVPNAVGLVFDEQQHLVIPHFVDKSAFDAPVPVALGDGRLATATFVASDKLADVTVLQLHDIKAKPATLSAAKPVPGTLLLVMSLNPAANRLTVWEGWEPDFAALVNIDGGIAGFCKGGRYFSAVAARPVVADLIDYGLVRRAFLGVGVEPVPPNDPQRQADAALGTIPAIRIREVIPDSAAQRGGLLPGDLILALAGQPVGDAPSFAAAIANRRGNTVMTVLRDTQRLAITVDLQVNK